MGTETRVFLQLFGIYAMRFFGAMRDAVCTTLALLMTIGGVGVIAQYGYDLPRAIVLVASVLFLFAEVTAFFRWGGDIRLRSALPNVCMAILAAGWMAFGVLLILGLRSGELTEYQPVYWTTAIVLLVSNLPELVVSLLLCRKKARESASILSEKMSEKLGGRKLI